MLSSYSVLVNLNRGTLHKFYVYYTLSMKNFGRYYFRTPDLFKNNNVRKLFLTLKVDKNTKKIKVQFFLLKDTINPLELFLEKRQFFNQDNQ